MATRASVRISDGHTSLNFYVHENGEPESVMPILMWYIEQVKRGIYRDNTTQAAGWLLVYGHKHRNESEPWKVGMFEPCEFISNNAEYHYFIGLASKTVLACKVKNQIEEPESRFIGMENLELLMEY